MAIENLECTIRDRETGAKSPPYRVPGDPEDAKALQKLLEELAKGGTTCLTTRLGDPATR